jgi:hypothetical protein
VSVSLDERGRVYEEDEMMEDSDDIAMYEEADDDDDDDIFTPVKRRERYAMSNHSWAYKLFSTCSCP